MHPTTKQVLHRLGYNAETQEYTEYAPLPRSVCGQEVAQSVQSVFTQVRCIVLDQEQMLLCVSKSAEDARSASWYACGLAAGAGAHNLFLL